jgi:hypothetical protein
MGHIWGIGWEYRENLYSSSEYLIMGGILKRGEYGKQVNGYFNSLHGVILFA